MEQLNWRQRYAGEEMVELAREGAIDRREMLRRLVSICGSTAAAVALLASCGDAGDASSDTADASTTGTPSSTSAPPTSVTAGTTAPAATSTSAATGTAVLSVAPDDPAVKASNVELTGKGGTVFAYEAQPVADGRRAGVIVIHEIFGMNDHIRDVARRVAKAGYHTVAVDLASRAGGTDKAPDVRAALTQTPIEDLLADLDTGLARLEGQASSNGRFGVVGFCYGGGMTLSYAAAQPKLHAAVPYYGPTPSPASQLASAKAAILAQYGETDTRVNAGIPDLEKALAGKPHEVRIYKGAGHGFNADGRDSYNETAAVEAWNATLAWFAKYLTA